MALLPKLLAQSDARGMPRPYPTINEIIEARSRLTIAKDPGPFDDMTAEMLRALCPTLVYVVAYHFAKRIRSPENSTILPWAKFAILF